MSIQDTAIERKDFGVHIWNYVARIGWGMGLAGALMLAWAGGVREAATPPYLIKSAFPACPLDQKTESKVEVESEKEVVRYPFVASKRGTKYYPANCPAAQKLSSKNRIGFSTEEEARAAGYTPASTC